MRLALACSLFVVAACAAEPTPAVDLQPSVAFADLKPYTGMKKAVTVKASASDDHGVYAVELLAGDSRQVVARATQEPFDIVWSTIHVADGLTAVRLRATDSSGQTSESEPLTVIVANGTTMTEPAYLDGNSGNVLVPADYDPAAPTVELDKKNHWSNPAGVTKIMAVVDWAVPAGQSPWEIGLRVGIGECPDSGTAIGAEVVGTQGPLFLSVDVPADQATTGMHFVHMRPANWSAHKGESLPYSVHVYLVK